MIGILVGLIIKVVIMKDRLYQAKKRTVFAEKCLSNSV